MRRIVVSVFMFALLAGSGASARAQGADPAIQKYLAFRVTIGADGKLLTATPLDATVGMDLIRAAVALAKTLEFEPAQAEGKAATSETTLAMTVQGFRQADGTYKFGMKSAQLLTEAVTRVPSIYPRSAQKHKAGAIIELSYLVRPDGSVDATQTKLLRAETADGSERDQSDMVKAATEAIAKWRFKPDLVAGRPVATLNVLSMRFCLSGQGACDNPVQPAPSPEMLALPRTVTPGLSLPVLHRLASAPPMRAGETSLVRVRIGVDAAGNLSSLKILNKDLSDALAAAVRSKLQAAHFFPAQAHGKPVSCELTITVPVRDERASGGDLRVQLDRVGYDFQLLAAPYPSTPQEMSRSGIDARVRYRVVTRPDGRADMARSRVESVELAPNAPGMRRKLEANILESIRYIRVEPTSVEGQTIPIEFVRGVYFCTDIKRKCAFDSLDEITLAAAREPAVLPAGLSLARLVP